MTWKVVPLLFVLLTACGSGEPDNIEQVEYGCASAYLIAQSLAKADVQAIERDGQAQLIMLVSTGDSELTEIAKSEIVPALKAASRFGIVGDAAKVNIVKRIGNAFGKYMQRCVELLD